MVVADDFRFSVGFAARQVVEPSTTKCRWYWRCRWKLQYTAVRRYHLHRTLTASVQREAGRCAGGRAVLSIHMVQPPTDMCKWGYRVTIFITANLRMCTLGAVTLLLVVVLQHDVQPLSAAGVRVQLFQKYGGIAGSGRESGTSSSERDKTTTQRGSWCGSQQLTGTPGRNEELPACLSCTFPCTNTTTRTTVGLHRAGSHDASGNARC